ncbi:TetR/AcrR family transcriptional regulator [Commensalibacter oyaizuii]|uniref:TetR/AcrR family transcriptional regulator n=1 Tax=Commensalibacter oyaizuii TaxID=3043873 RepID=A0ABT6PYU4_9PROT|nr:TetR/AcrR family transcriptional regulator [Commensalibacter sp. TBRC 16381]MDI2090023.1 TetR/AcrR family transcriptional regulator [Commensalibacter sp. TBRC 16381]
MNATHQNDKKELLLRTGLEIFSTHGFNHVGLSTLLKKAGIPKGSFYYYFESKEEYGVAVIHYYFDNYLKTISTLFENNALSGKERLLSYWKKWYDVQCVNNFEGRCLIVKISSEIADYSDSMREAFRQGTEKVLLEITKILIIGQQDNSIPKYLNPSDTAHLLYQQWLGASLLTKIQKNSFPFEQAFQYTHNLLAT